MSNKYMFSLLISLGLAANIVAVEPVNASLASIKAIASNIGTIGKNIAHGAGNVATLFNPGLGGIEKVTEDLIDITDCLSRHPIWYLTSLLMGGYITYKTYKACCAACKSIKRWWNPPTPIVTTKVTTEQVTTEKP